MELVKLGSVVMHGALNSFACQENFKSMQRATLCSILQFKSYVFENVVLM